MNPPPTNDQKSLLGYLFLGPPQSPPPQSCPLTLSRGLHRCTCRVRDRPGLFGGTVGTGYQVPGRTEARQGPQEASQGLHGAGGKR